MSEIQKISDIINNLQEIMKAHGDLPLVTANDDEGNGFNYVYFDPTVGTYDGERDGEFMSEKNQEEITEEDEEDDSYGPYENKVVCIN